jgi:hypothetical protein
MWFTHDARHRLRALAGVVAFGLGIPATSAAGDVRLLGDTGRWESGYGETFYNVVGKLQNDTGKTLRFVKLRVELLDAKGKVLTHSDTYNETAEALTVPDLDPKQLLATGKIKPVEIGQEQRFRTSFLKDETPAFSTHRVRVIESPAAAP